jgi:Na(+)-translocating NADH:ubiquinone oxidoreductase B subunit
VKLLAGLLERFRPHFEEGGRLRAMKPVFDATDAFFFSPIARAPGAPHVRDPLDVKRFMSVVIVALLPCLFASVYFFGLRVLAMILVSYAAGGTVEVLFAVTRKEEINEGFLVTGMIFPLVLPPTVPLWMVGLGCAFGVLVGKELFGGTGRNLFNPALVGRCFLVLAYPTLMSACWISPGEGRLGRLGQYVEVTKFKKESGPITYEARVNFREVPAERIPDVVSKATPLVDMKAAMKKDVEGTRAAGQRGTAPGTLDLFLGRVAGCAGETSALAVILGGLFLLLTRVANWRTVAGSLGAFALLGLVLHALLPGRFAPLGPHLFAGGLLFGSFFMATDPVTCPVSNAGKWIYGALIGGITLLIRNLTGYMEGAMFAILLGNIVAPILDHVVVRIRLRRLRHEG